MCESQDQITRLFVYGTLAPGKQNHHVMHGISGSWEHATMRGTLFKQGWGAAHDCPGVVPDANGDEVQGLLFTAENLPTYWQMLDDFEGHEYQRVVVPVILHNGTQMDACVYAIREPGNTSYNN